MKLQIKLFASEVPMNEIDPQTNDHLSKLELRIISAIARGMKNHEIAQHLQIDKDSIKSRLKMIFRKLSSRIKKLR